MEYERSGVPAVSHAWVQAPDYSGVDTRTRIAARGNRAIDATTRITSPLARHYGSSSPDLQPRLVGRAMTREKPPENLTGADFARKGEVFFAYSAAVLTETN